MFAAFGLLAIESATTLFLLGLALAGAGILRATSRRMRRRAEMAEHSVKTVRPVTARPGEILDAPAALSRYEVAMHELARDLTGQIDSKLALLQHLIHDAADQTARLEAALAEARAMGLDPLVVAAEQNASRPVNLVRQISQHDWSAMSGQDDSSLLEPRVRTIDVHERIRAAAAQGASAAAIAQQLGLPQGEVELVLSVPKSASRPA